MGSQTTGQREAKHFTWEGYDTLQRAQDAMTGGQPFQAAIQNVLGLLQNPSSFSPDVVAGMKQNNQVSAQNAYNTNQLAADNRAAASTGFRSGPARDAERYNSMQLADMVSSGNRQIDTQAAMQRIPDAMNVLSAAMPYIQLPNQLPSQQAQLLGGFATAPILGQPSPTASALGGIGSLGGSVLGNAGLFKGGRHG